MKKCKIKKTLKLIKQLKPYWAKFKEIEDKYYEDMLELEKEMSKELKIEELEIFFVDNEAVGIGTYTRTMELIRREEFNG